MSNSTKERIENQRFVLRSNMNRFCLSIEEKEYFDNKVKHELIGCFLHANRNDPFLNIPEMQKCIVVQLNKTLNKHIQEYLEWCLDLGIDIYPQPEERQGEQKKESPGLKNIKEMSLMDVTVLRNELASKLNLTLKVIGDIEQMPPDLLDDGAGVLEVVNYEDKILSSKSTPELRVLFHAVQEISRRIKKHTDIC